MAYGLFPTGGMPSANSAGIKLVSIKETSIGNYEKCNNSINRIFEQFSVRYRNSCRKPCHHASLQG
jgi:hypothetical protein